MSGHARADDLSAGYEALRAQVVGDVGADSPRGLALVLTHGLPAWIRAWAAPPPAVPPIPVVGRGATSGLGGEVVRLLTEMALGHGAVSAGAS
jgi:hypothetical protein